MVKQPSLLSRWHEFKSENGKVFIIFFLNIKRYYDWVLLFFNRMNYDWVFFFFFANGVLKTKQAVSLTKQCNAGVMFFKDQNCAGRF